MFGLILAAAVALAGHAPLAGGTMAAAGAVDPSWLAVLGSAQDWRGVSFQGAQFEQVRQYAAEHWLGAAPDSPQAWVAAAGGALFTLTPTAELLPEAFLRSRRDLPEDHGRFGGPFAPLQCGSKPVAGVLLHRVPPAAELWRPDAAAAVSHAAMARERRAKLRAAWATIPFGRKEFLCAMGWLETEILRSGAGSVRPPGAWEDDARPATSGVDFAWINAASGYLKALDPHSDLVARTFWEREGQPNRTAPAADVGLQLLETAGLIAVDDVARDSPAWRAGVRVGDQLERVGGKPVAGSQLAEVNTALTGPAGSKVRLGLRRVGKPLELTLSRRVDITANVEARLLDEDPTLGIVRIRGFVDDTATVVKKALYRLKKVSRGRLRGVVLDLRGDGGGVLNEAVQVADLLLASGRIVTVRRREAPEQPFEARTSPDDVAWPLAMLVDGGCASACEVLAAALRDHGRAVVLGERTFGKASVQQLFRPFSAQYLIKLTIARYFGPRGDSLQAVGVVPDLEVPMRPGAPPEARQREADLRGHLEAQTHEVELVGDASLIGNPLTTEVFRECMARTGDAQAAWSRDPTPRSRPDFQALAAIDVLHCLNARSR